MSDSSVPSVNNWLEEELFEQYRYDRQTVDGSWKQVFEGNGAIITAESALVALDRGDAPPEPRALPAPAAPVIPLGPDDQTVPLRGPALKIAENMALSLAIPTATSFRALPVKVMDENRAAINAYRAARGQSKISYTHLVAWAIVRAVEKVPALNDAFSGNASLRIRRGHVNIGLAVDVAGKDGARSLKVPSIKKSEAMNFAEFLAAYDDIVVRARGNKLTVADFEGTTISLTNPGTVGTAGSDSAPDARPGSHHRHRRHRLSARIPRSCPPDAAVRLGLGKVMTVTCTYDHRVIQGAESGLFLAELQSLLEGESEFYDRVYDSLAIPLRPVRWEVDQPSAPVVNADPVKQAGIVTLIQAWRERGHLAADIDPLGIPRPAHPDLDPSAHGLTIWDLDRTFHEKSGATTLRQLLDRLRRTYAGKMGVEYMHCDAPEERAWFQQYMEPTANQWPLSAERKRRALKSVVEAEGFESFLENRFKGHKRFSIEGGEPTIAILDELLDRASAGGVNECVIGMAHRGRLDVLANVIGKGIAQVFSEFEGEIAEEDFEGSGDVKYHLGASNQRVMPSGKSITVSVAPNPSHLEAVNPVVEGIVRPKQDRLGDAKRERVIPILIHGDAAMAGQGIVAETLNLSQIDGYNTGGTIHLVINNQIGFTTNPRASRSSDVLLRRGADGACSRVAREWRRPGSLRPRRATRLRFPPALPPRRRDRHAVLAQAWPQ